MRAVSAISRSLCPDCFLPRHGNGCSEARVNRRLTSDNARLSNENRIMRVALELIADGGDVPLPIRGTAIKALHDSSPKH